MNRREFLALIGAGWIGGLMARFGDQLADALKKAGTPASDAEALRLAGNQVGGEALAPEKAFQAIEVSGETRLEGDVLIGRDVGVEPNLFWDASEKELQFRSGKTTVAHLSSAGGLAQDGAKVHRNSSQSVPSTLGADTYVSFSSAMYDDAGFFSSGTDATKLTIPAGASGRYEIGFYVQANPGTAGTAVYARIVKNAESSGLINDGSLSNLPFSYLSGRTDVPLDAGDYLRLGISHSGSSAGSVYAGDYHPSMYIRRIR